MPKAVRPLTPTREVISTGASFVPVPRGRRRSCAARGPRLRLQTVCLGQIFCSVQVDSGVVTKLGAPTPPPAQRRLLTPARALPKAHNTPEPRRILDAFLELYRHGCGERCSLYRGPRRVERHPRPVDRPSRPSRAPRPPARPPRNEAGAPRPRPACHRWGASLKSAGACAARRHLRGSGAGSAAALPCLSLPSVLRHRGLGAERAAHPHARQLGFGVPGRGKGKDTALLLQASLTWLNSGSLQKLHLRALG